MAYKLNRLTKIAFKLPVVIGMALWVRKRIRKGVKILIVTDVDIQNCIDKCTQAGQKIRTIANDTVDHRARYALSEADRHIELCIHSCLDAKNITKTMNKS